MSFGRDSSTLPQPIIVLETFLQDSSDVPDGIDAQLTFNASAGTTYSYETTGLSAGDTLRFALQADATSLDSGRYDYSVELTADMNGTPVDHTYSGTYDVVNRGDSTHPFGRGWQLAGLDELMIDTGGENGTGPNGINLSVTFVTHVVKCRHPSNAIEPRRAAIEWTLA